MFHFIVINEKMTNWDCLSGLMKRIDIIIQGDVFGSIAAIFKKFVAMVTWLCLLIIVIIYKPLMLLKLKHLQTSYHVQIKNFNCVI